MLITVNMIVFGSLDEGEVHSEVGRCQKLVCCVPGDVF